MAYMTSTHVYTVLGVGLWCSRPFYGLEDRVDRGYGNWDSSLLTFTLRKYIRHRSLKSDRLAEELYTSDRNRQAQVFGVPLDRQLDYRWYKRTVSSSIDRFFQHRQRSHFACPLNDPIVLGCIMPNTRTIGLCVIHSSRTQKHPMCSPRPLRRYACGDCLAIVCRRSLSGATRVQTNLVPQYCYIYLFYFFITNIVRDVEH